MLGCTVVSLSAWNTMVGTVRPASLAIASLEGRRGVPAPPCRMAAKAEGRSRGGTTGEAGMHPDGCVEIGIGCPHDRGRGTACGEPCDIDAGRIHGVVAHDLAGDARDQSGLSAIPLLITGTKPIPALLGVGGRRLGRIGDQEDLLLRQRVHPCAGSKIVGRLSASVQHDDEWNGLTRTKSAWDIQLVGAAPMRARMNGRPRTARRPVPARQ